MIAIIYNNLKDILDHNLDSLKTAENFLKVVEDAGMCPPEHLFTSGEREGHWLHEWEPENKS